MSQVTAILAFTERLELLHRNVMRNPG